MRKQGKYMRVQTTLPGRSAATTWYARTQAAREANPTLGPVVGTYSSFFGVIWLVIAFFPILYMFMSSLRPQIDFLTDVPWLPPSHPTLANYQNVLQNDFGLYFANSVFVTLISVLLIVAVSLFAAYAISRISMASHE